MKQIKVFHEDGSTLLTAEAVAELAGCKVATLNSYLSRGQMPMPLGLSGRTRLWSESTIRTWLDHRTELKIIIELRNKPRWVRYKLTLANNGKMTKVPKTITGRAGSSTNPGTWASYEEVIESPVGDGFGFVLNNDGIMCIDLDHCVEDGKPNQLALDFIATLPRTYIEFSPSGDGLHIWGYGKVPDTMPNKENVNGLSIERYCTGRYMTVTCNPYINSSFAQIM